MGMYGALKSSKIAARSYHPFLEAVPAISLVLSFTHLRVGSLLDLTIIKATLGTFLRDVFVGIIHVRVLLCLKTSEIISIHSDTSVICLVFLPTVMMKPTNMIWCSE